jgi:dTDP-4-dehydrorhamnose reductase
LSVERVVPIATRDYPVKATRPLNSRLDLSRLAASFGVVPPSWTDGLEPELDRLVAQLD